MIPNVPSREPSESMPAGHKPRRYGRLRCEMLRCPIGTVEDLSMAGMCVYGQGTTPYQANQQLWMTLQGLFGELKIKSRVVWTEQTAPKRFAIGFEFIDVDPRTRQALAELLRISARMQPTTMTYDE